jgi:hypothetical protein
MDDLVRKLNPSRFPFTAGISDLRLFARSILSIMAAKKYDDLSKEELVRLLESRDLRDASRFEYVHVQVEAVPEVWPDDLECGFRGKRCNTR